MWDIIISLIYHQYSRNYLAAARKRSTWVLRPSARLRQFNICPFGFWSIDMTEAIARIFPHASTTSVANIDTFVRVALFSGVGLLLSLSVLLLDQYIPGDWF